MHECPRCHTEYSPGNKFCGNCGYNLAADSQYTTLYNQKDLNVSEIRINLGVIYLKQGKYDLAAQNFEHVLSSDPDHAAAKKLLEETRIAQQHEWS